MICHFLDSGVVAGCCIDRACAVLTHRSLTDMNSGRCQHVLPAARGAERSGLRSQGNIQSMAVRAARDTDIEWHQGDLDGPLIGTLEKKIFFLISTRRQKQSS